MIKRIIFDLDDTLITWDEKNWNSLKKTMNDNGHDCDDSLINLLKESIRSTLGTNDPFTKDNLIKVIKDRNNISLSIKLVDKWLEELGSCAPDRLHDDIYATLDYLSKKYDLVVLTNWFTDSQKKRMEKAGLTKYFSNIYGIDDILPKPNMVAFKKAIGDFLPHECITIGDNESSDIIGSISCGIDAILFDPYGKRKNADLKRIGEIKQLSKIL